MCKSLTLKGCKDLTSCTNYFLSTIFLRRRGMRQFVFLEMKPSFDCRKRQWKLLRTLQLFWPENQSRQSRWWCHRGYIHLSRTVCDSAVTSLRIWTEPDPKDSKPPRRHKDVHNLQVSRQRSAIDYWNVIDNWEVIKGSTFNFISSFLPNFTAVRAGKCRSQSF